MEIASIIADLGGDAERGALRRGLVHEAARCKALLDWQGAELLMKRQLEMPDLTA